ncbi:MAG: DUF805 domain-containing protein [Cocleimonas sp.]
MEFNLLNKENRQHYSAVDVFSINGRIGRIEYFVYSTILPLSLFLVLASITALVTRLGSVATVVALPSTVSSIALVISVIAVLLFLIRLTIQRCHDFNVSGAWALLVVIPFAPIVFYLIPGNNGLNSYGEAPEPASSSIKIIAFLIITLLTAIAIYALATILGINLLGLI